MNPTLSSRHPGVDRLAAGAGVLLLVLGAVALLGGCSAGNADDQQAAADTPRAVPVEVARADRGQVTATWSGTAAIVVDHEATVSARVGGEIREILVEEGDQVAAGDVLARLDGDRLRLEMQEAEANLRKLERDLARNHTLADRGLISSEALEILEYEVASMRAVYERRALEYEYTRIRAPIDGVVAERLIRVGNSLGVDAPTFRITSHGPLLAYLHVPEREYARIDRGQPASIRVDALGGEAFDGEVIRISPVMDPDSGTFRVTVRFPDPDGRLRPGMFGRVSVIYDSRPDALLIPRVALLDGDGADAVFRINDGTAERQRITTGYASGDRVQVVDGLEPGDRVVIVGQSGLRDGARVELIGDTADLDS